MEQDVEAVTEAVPEVVTRVEMLPPDNMSTAPCIEPAVLQFPGTVLPPDTRRHGGILLHVFLAVYMFIGLAIVCDDFFVPALNKMSDGEGIHLTNSDVVVLCIL